MRQSSSGLILIHWKSALPTNATWELANDLQMGFPHFTLEDKSLKGEGIDMGKRIDEDEFEYPNIQ